MYAPDELLEQVKKEVLSEFPDQIISFDWSHEQECSFVGVQLGEIALQIPLGHRIREIANTIVGHPDDSDYIVPISVRASESVGATEGLFNMTYDAAGCNSFFVHYYAPERDRLIPFNISHYYDKMFEAIRTIHFDSPAQLWKRLVPPSRERAAKREGIESFSRELLAKELRDFLLKHLDFIIHIAQVTKKPLQILEPVPILAPSSNGTDENSFIEVQRTREMAHPAAHPAPHPMATA